MTDGNRTYRRIGEGFAAHQTVNHSRKTYANKTKGAHINTAEALISQARQALAEVCQRLAPQHLQRHLNEIARRWTKREPAERLNAGTGQALTPLPRPASPSGVGIASCREQPQAAASSRPGGCPEGGVGAQVLLRWVGSPAGSGRLPRRGLGLRVPGIRGSSARARHPGRDPD